MGVAVAISVLMSALGEGGPAWEFLPIMYLVLTSILFFRFLMPKVSETVLAFSSVALVYLSVQTMYESVARSESLNDVSIVPVLLAPLTLALTVWIWRVLISTDRHSNPESYTMVASFLLVNALIGLFLLFGFESTHTAISAILAGYVSYPLIAQGLYIFTPGALGVQRDASKESKERTQARVREYIESVGQKHFVQDLSKKNLVIVLSLLVVVMLTDFLTMLNALELVSVALIVLSYFVSRKKSDTVAK